MQHARALGGTTWKSGLWGTGGGDTSRLRAGVRTGTQAAGECGDQEHAGWRRREARTRLVADVEQVEAPPSRPLLGRASSVHGRLGVGWAVTCTP